MTKQVQEVADAHSGAQSQNKNLYISVQTFTPEGRPDGFRVVDMYHYGTRNWLQNHLWWGMHNSKSIEVNPASDEEIGKYLHEASEALAAKYNKEPAQDAVAAA